MTFREWYGASATRRLGIALIVAELTIGIGFLAATGSAGLLPMSAILGALGIVWVWNGSRDVQRARPSE